MSLILDKFLKYLANFPKNNPRPNFNPNKDLKRESIYYIKNLKNKSRTPKNDWRRVRLTYDKINPFSPHTISREEIKTT